MHIHWYQQQAYPIPGCAPVYPQVWCGTVTSGGTSDFAATVTTAAAAGAPAAYIVSN
jgi:hypothetical protein